MTDFIRRLFGRGEPPAGQEGPTGPEWQDLRTPVPEGGYELVPGTGSLALHAEHDYRGAIARLSGGERPDGVNVTMTAALVHEPQNQYDPNAISVRIKGDVVGYLDKRDAKAYLPVMDALKARGLAPYCRVDIHGGEEHTGRGIADFRIRVCIDKPERQLEQLAKS